MEQSGRVSGAAPISPQSIRTRCSLGRAAGLLRSRFRSSGRLGLGTLGGDARGVSGDNSHRVLLRCLPSSNRRCSGGGSCRIRRRHIHGSGTVARIVRRRLGRSIGSGTDNRSYNLRNHRPRGLDGDIYHWRVRCNNHRWWGLCDGLGLSRGRAGLACTHIAQVIRMSTCAAEGRGGSRHIIDRVMVESPLHLPTLLCADGGIPLATPHSALCSPEEVAPLTRGSTRSKSRPKRVCSISRNSSANSDTCRGG